MPASDEDEEQAQEEQAQEEQAQEEQAQEEQAQELGQLLPDPAPPPTLERPRERPVAARWPHCVDYESLLAAIARLESAESAVEDAQEDLEEAEAAYRAADAAGDDVGRFDADQSRLNALIALEDAELARDGAIIGFEFASDAVASAEALVADTAADNEARVAGERAIEAYAAAVDAANFATFGRVAVGLGTPAYDAAYESALAAALGEAGTGRVTAEARVLAAESAAKQALWLRRPPASWARP